MSVFIYNVSFDDKEVMALIKALEFYIDMNAMDSKCDFENGKSMSTLLEKIKRYENIRMVESTYPNQMLVKSSSRAKVPDVARAQARVVPESVFNGYSTEEVTKAQDVIDFILHSPNPPVSVGKLKASKTNDEFVNAMIALFSEFFVAKKWLAQDAFMRVDYRSTLSARFYAFTEKKLMKK